MLTRIIIIISAIFVAIYPSYAFARENSGKVIFRKKFDKFTTSFETDYRWSETRLEHRHYDFGIKIPFADGWSTSINYRSMYKYKSKKGKWILEKRPHISLQKVFDTEFLKIQLRTRQEYRYRGDDTESTRNRSRIMLKSNKSILYMKPFVSNEWFYDMDDEKYNKNWLAAGVDFPKTDFGKYSLYYVHVTDLDDDNNWTSDYRITLKAIYEF